MVDFSVFGDYQNPVEFNFSTAEGFSSQLRWTSQRINIFDARTSLVESIASRGFRGFFATVFTQNIHICSADAMALSEALTTAADMVDYLAEQARLENKRRQQVRDFAAQHDDFGDHVRDFFTGVDVPPNLTPAESPSPQLLHPPVTGDRQQDRSIRGSSGGISAADPKDLISAAQVLGEAAAQVPSGSVLAGWFDDFTSQCKYGTVEVGDLFVQLDRWRGLNDGDVEWLHAVAKAFQAAGSGVITLPNSALRAALRAAGTPLWRTDLDITSPGLSGIDPRTGYLEDPINSATGNFIEPETDLAFAAASPPPSPSAGCTTLFRLFGDRVGFSARGGSASLTSACSSSRGASSGCVRMAGISPSRWRLHRQQSCRRPISCPIRQRKTKSLSNSGELRVRICGSAGSLLPNFRSSFAIRPHQNGCG